MFCSCTRSGLICIVYVLAFLVGLLALLLPNWVSAKFEAERTVTVVKEIDSGLFKEHSKYYMKDDTLPDECDNPFQDISETYIYPEVVRIVKAFMIIGLCLLTFALIHSIYRCCCHDEDKSGKTSAIIYVVLSVITIASGGFIVSCPFIIKSHVIADFDPENISLGASWWLALVSAILIFLVGLVTAVHSLYTLCEAISKSNEQTMLRSKQENVFTIY